MNKRIQTQQQQLDQLNKQISNLTILASNDNPAVRRNAYSKLKTAVKKRNEIKAIFNPIFG